MYLFLTTSASTSPYNSSTGGGTVYPGTTNATFTLGSSSTHQLGTWGPLVSGASRMLTAADIKSSDFGVMAEAYPGSSGMTFSIDYITVKVYYSTKVYVLNEYQELAVWRKLNSSGFDSRQQPFQLQYAFVPNDGDSYLYSSDWTSYKSGIGTAFDSIQSFSDRQGIILTELKR
jgi:hypothetical protein